MYVQRHRNLKTAHQVKKTTSWEGRSIGCLRQKAGVETAGMGRAKS